MPTACSCSAWRGGGRGRALFARIKADPRHTDVDLLHALPTTRRHFGDWWMGCARVDDFDALARVRNAWETAIVTMDRDAVLSPGFVLVKSIWEDLHRAGSIEPSPEWAPIRRSGTTGAK